MYSATPVVCEGPDAAQKPCTHLVSRELNKARHDPRNSPGEMGSSVIRKSRLIQIMNMPVIRGVLLNNKWLITGV